MANVNIRVDDNLKRDTENILSELGISMSAATNMFYKQVVRYGGIPFDLRVSPVYFYTNLLLADAKEVDEAIANGTAKIYETPDEMFDAWERERK